MAPKRTSHRPTSRFSLDCPCFRPVWSRPVPFATLVPRTLGRVQVDKEDRVNAVVQLIRLVGAGVMAGVLVAFVALPLVGSGGLVARDAANNFQNMPADINTQPVRPHLPGQ